MKSFCTEKLMKINSSKTQVIIFKAPSRRIIDGFSVQIDGISIKPSASIKLLGVTVDQHFTFSEHIDNIVTRCHGLIGVLRRASKSLPEQILRLAYLALVRCHLEYGSAIFASASKTNLHKLDIVQKIADM